MSESDWDKVTYLRKKQPKASQMRSQQAINTAQRKGVAIETTKKFNAATNKQHHTTLNTAKLDRETEELYHDKVTLEVGKMIQQARQAKGWTQKDLATRVNEKPQVINDYEAGRAIPNQQIFSKLERTLAVKLRGREKGNPVKIGGKDYTSMSESDWDTVTYLRKKQPKASQMRSQQAINAAQRQGVAIETTKKFNAATNKQHHTTLNTAKLDRETEELHHDKVTLEVGKMIQQARQAKGWTQKDLATRVNEKPQVINDYEAGRAIPNQQILSKLERTLGMKLRGKEKGNQVNIGAKDE
uniref:HTH cro/C1-type domain-containing protein n=1 Tax=Strigamia maritima TaxID=126957 RepID=T1J792_STRMM